MIRMSSGSVPAGRSDAPRSRRSPRRAGLLLLLAVALTAGPASAGGVEAPLAPGTVEWGAVSGYGRSFSLRGPEAGIDFFSFAPRLGYVFATLDGKPPFKGSVEVVGEAPLLVAFESRTIYGGGFTALLAYHVATGTRLVPFLEGGAGILLSAPRSTDRASQFHDAQFNFTPQAGAGLRYRIGDRAALTLEYRFAHISSAGLTERNGGLNASFVLFGVSLLR